MDDGVIVESPTTDTDADGYMFYSLGVTRDGEVVAVQSHPDRLLPEARRRRFRHDRPHQPYPRVVERGAALPLYQPLQLFYPRNPEAASW